MNLTHQTAGDPDRDIAGLVAEKERNAMAKSDKKIKVTTTPITEEELLRVYFGAVSLGASSFAATYLPEIPSGHAGRLVEEMIAAMQRDPLGRETALQHARAILDGKKLEGLLLTIRLPGEGE